MRTLKQREVIVFGPDSGIQACGDIGEGRMQQPESIAEQVANCFETGQLSGKKVVISAGPTREAIDPVRYISNHSSGKMGYALAAAAVEAGAEVTIVSGPVELAVPDRCSVTSVISAAEMHSAVIAACADADIFIAAAAVADYRPLSVAEQKIKKQDDRIELKLEKNMDIVSTVADSFSDLFVVGFAAETQNIEANATGKLSRKKLDAIVANDVSRTDVGFNSDHNEAWWITADGRQAFGKRSKAQLARDIVGAISETIKG